MERIMWMIESRLDEIKALGGKLLIALIVFAVGSLLIKWIRGIAKKSMDHANTDPAARKFIESLIKAILYIILLFFVGDSLGINFSPLFALMASAGVTAALALQSPLSNLVGGILILMLKPFAQGDYIREDSKGNEGTVKEIQLFYTRLQTVDNQTVLIPNGTLVNNSMTNITAQDKRKLDLRIGISYESDLKKAKAILERIVRSYPQVAEDKDLIVFVSELADSAVILGARAWVPTDAYWPVRWAILEEVKLTFDEEGISIPYPQMSVHLASTKNNNDFD